MFGGADPDRILAAVVGTDMRGERINGAPRGVAGDRNCCAAKPGMAGDNIRDSAATAATRRQSSSPVAFCNMKSGIRKPVIYFFF